MSFQIICPNCGAPSSPMVGVCPFCKSVMSTEEEKHSPSIARIKSLFNEGNTEQALILAKDLEITKPDFLKNVNFVLVYVQILIEVDAPSGQIKSLLVRALNEHPSHPQLAEYLEVIEARSHLSQGKDDIGEVMLANIIRRSPDNVHALFLLGSHLFWVEKDTQRALKYLEHCVRLRPNFIRAKACLAAVYKGLELNDHTARLLSECAAKTSDANLKVFFKNLAKSEVE